MGRNTGKGLGPVLALGGAGLVLGIALFMTLFAAEARRVDSCEQVAGFVKPRLAIVERDSDEKLAGLTSGSQWHEGAFQLADTYLALGTDLGNGKLLAPSDPDMAATADALGRRSSQLAKKLSALEGKLVESEELEAATVNLRDEIAAAGSYCQ